MNPDHISPAWPPVTYRDNPPLGTVRAEEFKPTLCERTYRALRDRIEASTEETVRDMAAQAGLDYYWLRQFSTGSIKDPSVNRIERLYHFLTGQTL